jgi:hypothetical protein
LTAAIMLLGSAICNAQATIPEILVKGSVSDQMNYIETNTRIYENYRAIREDMFQMLKNHAIDSLAKAKTNIMELGQLRNTLNLQIDSLNNTLDLAKEAASELSRTKNSIRVLGMEINKLTYNSIMWTIVAVLASLLVLGFLIFKRNLVASLTNKNDLKDLRIEFEAYRQKTRIEREKVSMDHFNEIRKLKGK